MKPSPFVASFCLLLLGVVALPAAGQEPPVVAQDLKSLRVPGKISTALWTRRKEFFTLQLVFQRAPQGANQVTKPGIVASQPADVEVWLQRADGTPIPPMRRWETPAAQENCIRCISFDVEYFFPLSVDTDAVAVAMKFGDVLYTEKLKPLGGKL